MVATAEFINNRTATRATIKRASAKARRNLVQIDKETLQELQQIYENALYDLRDRMAIYADRDGSLRLETLQAIMGQINDRLAQLAIDRNAFLSRSLSMSASNGAEAFSGIVAGLPRIAENALKYVIEFTAADGLQLSDRIWRLNLHTKRLVSEAISSAIIQGHSASQTALDFLNQGRPIPPDIRQDMKKNGIENVKRVLGQALMTGEGSPYNNARRLFRTEINRAHGEAYRASAFELPDAIGTRFLLSPNHPEVDICDMHAEVNRFGLGPGVYPKGKSPWPAHPNTLSFEEIVFADEVGAEDKSGKQGRIQWLKDQPQAMQTSMLGRYKAQALKQDILTENEINTPWRILKKKYEKRGVNIEIAQFNTVVPVRGSRSSQTKTLEPFLPFDDIELAKAWAQRRGTELRPGKVSNSSVNSALSGITDVLDPYNIANTAIVFDERLKNHVTALAGTSRDGLIRYIKFAPGYAKTPAVALRKEKEARVRFLNNKQEKIELLSKQMNSGNLDSATKAKFQEKIDEIKMSKRFGVSEDMRVKDPIRSVAMHEAAHTLYFVKKLKLSWARSLSKHRVTRKDMLTVSDYAASDIDELFAETLAAVFEGFDDIAANLRSAFDEVLNEITTM